MDWALPFRLKPKLPAASRLSRDAGGHLTTGRCPAEVDLSIIRWRRAARRRRVRRRLSLASFARQKRAKRPQVQVEIDDGENQGHQALLHRLRVGVDPEPAYRSALIRCDHAILAICHQLYSCESSMASIRPRIDVTSARSDTLTRSTSAMDKVMSPTMTTPPASTRSSRSTRATRSPWSTGSYPGPVIADLTHRPRRRRSRQARGPSA